MCKMGWIDNTPITLTHNNSTRFESRYCTVKILDASGVFFQDMSGTTIGVWIAHGEGRFQHAKPPAIVYNSDFYPYNPNGSDFNTAGISSLNGLHLAMMPHPERCIKSWQNPYYPPNWQSKIDATYDGMTMPWMKMFKNAYDFAIRQK